MALNNNGDDPVVLIKNPLTINVFTKVTVEQVKINGKYTFIVKFNGNQVASVINNVPAEFPNVKVFSGAPFYEPANAILKNLHVNAILDPEDVEPGKFFKR